MVDILDYAKKFAAPDPARDAVVAEKRAAMDAKATELFAATCPLAGQIVNVGADRGRINISRRPAFVDVTLTKRERHQHADGRIRYKDVPVILKSMELRGGEAGYAVKDFAGLVRQFGQVDDVVKFVAEQIGPMLVLEDE